MQFTEEVVKALFVIANIPVRSVYKIENQYWPDNDHYNDVRKGSPWFLVHIDEGIVRIGWRKRVMSIDWTGTPIKAILTEDDVTKDEQMVHAWNYPKAVEYLQQFAREIYKSKVV